MLGDFFRDETKVMVMVIKVKVKTNLQSYYWYFTNVLAHLYSVFLRDLSGKYSYYPHFMDKKTA